MIYPAVIFARNFSGNKNFNESFTGSRPERNMHFLLKNNPCLMTFLKNGLGEMLKFRTFNQTDRIP